MFSIRELNSIKENRFISEIPSNKSFLGYNPGWRLLIKQLKEHTSQSLETLDGIGLLHGSDQGILGSESEFPKPCPGGRPNIPGNSPVQTRTSPNKCNNQRQGGKNPKGKIWASVVEGLEVWKQEELMLLSPSPYCLPHDRPINQETSCWDKG